MLEITSMQQLFIMIKKDNIGAREVIERVGFEVVNQDDNNLTYRYGKPSVKLMKTLNA